MNIKQPAAFLLALHGSSTQRQARSNTAAISSRHRQNAHPFIDQTITFIMNEDDPEIGDPLNLHRIARLCLVDISVNEDGAVHLVVTSRLEHQTTTNMI